jgi:hypothetical protein
MRKTDSEQEQDEQREQRTAAPVTLASPEVEEEERRRYDDEGRGNDGVGNSIKQDEALGRSFGWRGRSLCAEEEGEPACHYANLYQQRVFFGA